MVACVASKSLRQQLHAATGAAGVLIKKQELTTTEALRARLGELLEARKVDSRLATQVGRSVLCVWGACV